MKKYNENEKALLKKAVEYGRTASDRNAFIDYDDAEFCQFIFGLIFTYNDLGEAVSTDFIGDLIIAYGRGARERRTA